MFYSDKHSSLSYLYLQNRKKFYKTRQQATSGYVHGADSNARVDVDINDVRTDDANVGRINDVTFAPFCSFENFDYDHSLQTDHESGANVISYAKLKKLLETNTLAYFSRQLVSNKIKG